jgi:hypothetical protein
LKKRTKLQKIRAEQRRAEQVQQVVVPHGVQYHYTSSEKATEVPKTRSRVQENSVRQAYASELFAYDVRFIYTDLRKTIIIVTGIFIVLGILARF